MPTPSTVPRRPMIRFATAFAILLSLCTLMTQAIGQDEPQGDAKKSFLNGVARLKERQTAVFNEETLPALKPIKDVQITSEFLKVAATQPLKGVVRVRIRVTAESGHVKLFWFSLQEGKWIVTGCTSEPWSSKHPPKVSIGAGENEPFVGKVQACFK